MTLYIEEVRRLERIRKRAGPPSPCSIARCLQPPLPHARDGQFVYTFSASLKHGDSVYAEWRDESV